MIGALQAQAANVYNALPSTSQMANNLSKIALPALALGIIANIPTVDSGPITEIACIAGCHALILANPVLGIAWYSTCLQICFASGFLPTP